MASSTPSSSKFTLFYTSKSPFSQFYACTFVVDGVQYSRAEQYMMHQKAVLFKDDEIAEAILSAVKPGQMKALGRKVRGFDEKIWVENRERIVKKGNLAKFTQNADIKTELLSTSGTILVEASPRDKIWGIGLGASNPAALNKKMWKGQNLLGYILTDVRDTIITEEEKEDKVGSKRRRKLGPKGDENEGDKAKNVKQKSDSARE